jgi:hypothetical protein
MSDAMVAYRIFRALHKEWTQSRPWVVSQRRKRNVLVGTYIRGTVILTPTTLHAVPTVVLLYDPTLNSDNKPGILITSIQCLNGLNRLRQLVLL